MPPFKAWNWKHTASFLFTHFWLSVFIKTGPSASSVPLHRRELRELEIYRLTDRKRIGTRGRDLWGHQLSVRRPPAHQMRGREREREREMWNLHTHTQFTWTPGFLSAGKWSFLVAAFSIRLDLLTSCSHFHWEDITDLEWPQACFLTNNLFT